MTGARDGTEPATVGTARFTRCHGPDPKEPLFVEGLPGVGNVGKLACDHLADVLGAEPWFDIHSRDFPPQVMVNPDGTVRLAAARLWVAPKAADGRDVVILTGDFQPLSPAGQHDLVEGVLDRLEAAGCTQMYTLGGYGLGQSVDDPAVLGAATDTDTVERLQDLDVRFEEDEPGGGIIGASGLFLGLGMQRGMTGACLMGETSGFMVDPRAARRVLHVLEDAMGLGELQMDDLDDKARDIEAIQAHLRDAERPGGEAGDLHYIG